MNDSNLISDGALLMLIGMGTVFVFLSLLVFLTSLLQKFVTDNKAIQPRAEKLKTDDDEVAAVTAAVYAYRSKKLKNKD